MSATTNQETLLSLAQVAERYRVTPRTVQNWTANNHKFPQPIRFSRRLVRYRLTDLEAFERSDD
jgi:predicted DNA-binding transcriptional regulator AlpA